MKSAASAACVLFREIRKHECGDAVVVTLYFKVVIVARCTRRAQIEAHATKGGDDVRDEPGLVRGRERQEFWHDTT